MAMTAGRPSKKTKQQPTAQHDFSAESLEKFKINAEIPLNLYKAAKIHAVEENTTLTKLIQKSLEELLASNGKL